MEDADFSDEFFAFVQSKLPTVEAAEQLLERVRRGAWTPPDDATAAHVRTLERAWRERPVTLIRMIYALRDTKIRAFADAFRLRKK